MNLTEQQTPATQYTEQTAVVAPVSAHPLVLLENRLSGMATTINALKSKLSAMQEVLVNREQRITTLELENATFKQQVEQFNASHGQLMDGLVSMLARFPGEEALNATLAESTTADHMELLVETMGTA